VLERASGRSPAEVGAALDAAFLAGVIRELPRSAGRQEFTHALLRESLYWDLPPQQRRQLHRAAGDALEALDLVRDDEHLAALSHHFFQSAGPGELERPIRYGSEAAARACAGLAFEEGVRQYRRVLDMVALMRGFPVDEHIDLRLRLSEALDRAGRGDQARAERQAAAAQARQAGRPELLARVALSVAADLLPRLGETSAPTEVELLEEALAGLPASDDLVAARVLAQLAVRLSGSSRAAEAARFGARAVDIAARLGDPMLLAHARYAACLASLRPSAGLPDPSEPAAVVELADAARQPDLALCARVLQVRALLESGELERAEALAGDVARRAARLRTPRARCWSLLLRASLAGLRGELAQVDALLRAAHDEAERSADPAAAIDAHLLGVALHDLYGARPERSAALRELRARAEQAASGRAPVWLAWLDDPVAREVSPEVLALELAQTSDDPWTLARACTLARSCIQLGDRASAEALYERLLPHAARFAVAGLSLAVLAPISHRLGQLASVLGREADAARHFEDAIDHCARQHMPAHRIQAQLDYAAHLLERVASVEPAKLDELIGSALESARGLGAAALVSRALAARSALERSRS
jgi:hypothetical protein